MTMVNFFDVPPDLLIAELAEKLKKYPEIRPPENLMFWKTGCFKEFPPEDHENFWYVRCASLLRKVGKFGPIGINKLRKKYGGRKRRGVKPAHSARASGAIIRRAIQQLERSDLVKQDERGGRSLSKEGTSLVDRVAHQMLRRLPLRPIY
ncbi:MAG: 30S ribosomal protein S19e [Promethearchaeota archaeon]